MRQQLLQCAEEDSIIFHVGIRACFERDGNFFYPNDFYLSHKRMNQSTQLFFHFVASGITNITSVQE